MVMTAMMQRGDDGDAKMKTASKMTVGGPAQSFPPVFFSGGRPNFSKLSEEQKNRQTMNNTRLFY